MASGPEACYGEASTAVVDSCTRRTVLTRGGALLALAILILRNSVLLRATSFAILSILTFRLQRIHFLLFFGHEVRKRRHADR